MQSPGICLAIMSQMPKYARPHSSILCLNSLCYFFATFDSDEHILQYGCCYHTICVVHNCCLSLYLNIAGLQQGPAKMLLGSWKCPEIFGNQESGKPAIKI